ncbi:MAG: 2-amino-4-hydroxy-6-hydroxymethyldihydropteridine diphosphokinase, partial [Eudoraea sp.]|nr:2-amino-4-hydroxy-6-hydroxymethyldihydropteridine diphosphokinase [Eudoraea sp.]
MKEVKTIYLSLGSNLGNRLFNLQRAVILLQKELGFILEISGVYKSPSWGFDGEDFLNACLSLETDKTPSEVLEILLKVEKEMGRQRSEGAGYQSRNIDIDLLYYNSEIIQTDELTVPHPQMHLRRFVLKPLADIAPQFYHPILGKDTRNLLQECKDKTSLEQT